jgi:hypothetical protein
MIRDIITGGFLTGSGVCFILALVLIDKPNFPWLVLFGTAFGLIGLGARRRNR